MIESDYQLRNLGGRENADLINSHPAFGKYRGCYVDTRFWNRGDGDFSAVVEEYLERHGYDWFADSFAESVTDRERLNSDTPAKVILAIWKEQEYPRIFGGPATEGEIREFLGWFHPIWAEWAKENRPGELDSTWATAAQLLDDEMDTL